MKDVSNQVITKVGDSISDTLAQELWIQFNSLCDEDLVTLKAKELTHIRVLSMIQSQLTYYYLPKHR